MQQDRVPVGPPVQLACGPVWVAGCSRGSSSPRAEPQQEQQAYPAQRSAKGARSAATARAYTMLAANSTVADQKNRCAAAAAAACCLGHAPGRLHVTALRIRRRWASGGRPAGRRISLLQPQARLASVLLQGGADNPISSMRRQYAVPATSFGHIPACRGAILAWPSCPPLELQYGLARLLARTHCGRPALLQARSRRPTLQALVQRPAHAPFEYVQRAHK